MQIAANHEPARSQLDQVCEDYIEVTFGAGIQYMELQPEAPSRCLRIFNRDLSEIWTGRVNQ